jgi:diaminohydroxyphosphoribosylaminopyrimidine deaminase/5-amino-6-(5-phosphoribosylamino)uracil reductase
VRLFDEPYPQVPEPYLARACDLAERARGRTHPNPVVGCVIVASGAIIAEGFHARAGAPHAEAVALGQAGSAARGATVYVTLEPCNHQGRTGACTDALIDAGVARVVIGTPDPNPDVTGGGAERLRGAGIEVVFAEDATPFVSLNEDWVTAVTTDRPWVTLKTAVSLDGHPALRTDRRTPLTSADARAVTMDLRKRASVILVGAGTHATDSPSLLLCDENGDPAAVQPARAVLGRSRVPESLSIADGRGDVLLLLPDDLAGQSIPDGAELATYDGEAGLSSALRTLRDRGHTHVLLEAGPSLFTSAWVDGVIDELVLYHAGGILGASALPLFEGEAELEGDSLETRMGIREVGLAGCDAVTVWRPLGQDAAA